MANINIDKLRQILEDPEEFVTPRFILNIINRLIGLPKDEVLEIDYLWLTFERRYKINIARKDTLSASISFYYYPAQFFMDPNIFDKMAVAFNGHNVLTSIINKPTPEEATFAIQEARDIISEFYNAKYGAIYPLLPDVAKFVAALYHDKGLIVFHPSLSHYQNILDSLSLSSDLTESKKKILELFDKYKSGEDVSHILAKADEDHVYHNVAYLIAIDLYLVSGRSYTETLLDKVAD